jgi:hypothetical protein
MWLSDEDQTNLYWLSAMRGTGEAADSSIGAIEVCAVRPSALSARTRTTAEVAAIFARQGRSRFALISLAYFTVFYGTFALYASGRIPGWAFAFFGFFVFIRFFDATHEEFHSRFDGHPIWGVLRIIFSVSGPLQLGYAQLAKNHRGHHEYEGTPKDPDLWLMNAPPALALIHALSQPEQAVFRYVRANGLERRVAVDLVLNFAMYCGLAAACTWQQFALYNVVVRLGNGVSWWVFTYLLHQPKVFNGFSRLTLPRWLAMVWVVLIGRNNFNAISFHFLHHAYGFVPARTLPALSEYVR